MISLDNLTVNDLIKQSLIEDIGHGDLTTNAFVDKDMTMEALMTSREDGILSGIEIAEKVFKMLDENIEFTAFLKDGDKICQGQTIAKIKGKARAILTGERLALNFVQRMSAIATETNRYQKAIEPYKAKICDTRKSCPNFRIFEKYSVKIGGGSPHRFGLFDAVMIKDNHIKAARSIEAAVKTAREKIPHTIKIEVETETLEQVQQAIDAKADIIMLDNMDTKTMTQAVKLIDKKAITEASGRVSLESVNEIASCGVDYISTSAITAKAGIIDIALDV